MSTPFLVGLVGARGHTGRELIRLIAGHPELMLAYAVSREFAGRPVSDVAPEDKDECVFEALSPEEVAKRRADVVILAAPDGAAAPYVEAIETHAPGRVIIDLSADYRLLRHGDATRHCAAPAYAFGRSIGVRGFRLFRRGHEAEPEKRPGAA